MPTINFDQVETGKVNAPPNVIAWRLPSHLSPTIAPQFCRLWVGAVVQYDVVVCTLLVRLHLELVEHLRGG